MFFARLLASFFVTLTNGGLGQSLLPGAIPSFLAWIAARAQAQFSFVDLNSLQASGLFL